ESLATQGILRVWGQSFESANSGLGHLGHIAAAFYQRHGFVPLEQNPNHLYVLMEDLRAAIRRSLG
ncbi:MAG: hypothetical protein M3132_01780, partial [Actinomycetia bacterium]|nr:hypothetical protein [Actinomycetes bacterium]